MQSVITALPVRLPECPGVTDMVSQGRNVSGFTGGTGADPTSPQHLLVALPQSSNVSKPNPNPNCRK